MKIFIVVLHFGEIQTTNKCLESILREEKEFQEIVIVDNDLKSRFKIYDLRFKKKIKIIKNKENIGYAGGMNVGIRYVLSKGADYVLLLNNDIIFEKKITPFLIKFLEGRRDTGIVSAAIKFNKNGKTVFDLGGKINMMFGRTSHIEFSEAKFKSQISNLKSQINYVDYISGCFMMVKKEVFEKIGLLDEKFFMYYEDVDFCLRAKKAGFNIYCLPNVYILHDLSKTVGKNSSKAICYQTKSALIFGKKHTNFIILNLLFVLFQSTFIFLKNPPNGISAFKALFNYLKEKGE